MKTPTINKRNQYWDRQFSNGFIYGKKSSDIAKIALPFLSESKNILVLECSLKIVGCGCK